MTLVQETITFKAVELTQPIGSFYIGVIDSDDLAEIAWADVQRLGNRDFEEFLGIQRELSPTRVSELQKYVNTVDATFPTGIILAIDSKYAEYDAESATMRIVRDKNVAKIIDGQHRIAGLKAFNGERFQSNVVIFIDMELEDQAMVFATINLKQTKVSKSLAYNLFEYATSRSPQKTCHDIAKLLNKVDGPFQERIKILGVATPGVYGETLTQAAFVGRVLDLMSTDPDGDRDAIKRGGVNRLARASSNSRLVFRNPFIENKDAHVARVISNYFTAVENRWPEAWRSTERGWILGRTTGFAGLMRVLPDALTEIGATVDDIEPGLDDDAFDGLFKRSDLGDGWFTTEHYQAGTSGETKLATDVRRSVQLPVR
jgi:DGQHR domain-containing protein